MTTAEHRRLQHHRERRADWRRWGPYVSERAWGTVREDYSEDGEAWDYFPHDHARSRAYRWNEDGLGGFCDRFQTTCLGVALWNEKDPILKERLFGLSGPEGNHGEDVKEHYFYLDGVPSHAYMKMLYKYPQCAFPYGALVEENRRRGHDDDEVELHHVLERELAEDRLFDVTIEYAKVDEDDIVSRITVTNRGPDDARIHVLPHLWFRNTWTWDGTPKPKLEVDGDRVVATHPKAPQRHWWVDGEPRYLFTENETNKSRLFGVENESPFVKDGINKAIVDGDAAAVSETSGTKVAAHVVCDLSPGASRVIHVRLSTQHLVAPFEGIRAAFVARISEADEFYDTIHAYELGDDERRVQRQAYAGLLWTKQFYQFDVARWQDGDPNQPPAPKRTRNRAWRHLHANDVLSMPDKWEYPWFAAWDLAFHAVPFAPIDPDFAKRQLVLMLREWYMHPNGALPAYEWTFSDVNPPVHAWAAWQVYKIDRDLNGKADTVFLERVFQKLLLNFTWWVNRKDHSGNNAFEGGFLGLDNIGVFDRSKALPTGGRLEQADGTAWMAMYCLNMLGIALELATKLESYEDIATKFFEHYVYIVNAFYELRGRNARTSLWHEEDGFFYDVLNLPDGSVVPMRIRSFVGLIPLFAVGGLDPRLLEHLPHFRRRVEWFVENRPHLMARVGSLQLGTSGHHQVAVADRSKLERILKRVFDEDEFLSPYGLRSMSRRHAEEPYVFRWGGHEYTVGYEPAESRSGLFGGNSNWRGPIWFPINFLMIQALRKYHLNYGDSLKVEVPTGSGRWMTLDEAADELARRLTNIFLRDPETGRRAVFGGNDLFDEHPGWRDHLPFFEYFHGDSGAGLGASHQTGWTALVAQLLQGPVELGMPAERRG